MMKQASDSLGLVFDEALSRLLSEADLALGRLDGAAFLVPNPDLFVAMYVRQEAVLSSQIETFHRGRPRRADGIH